MYWLIATPWWVDRKATSGAESLPRRSPLRGCEKRHTAGRHPGYAASTVKRVPDFLSLLGPDDRAALDAVAMRRGYSRRPILPPRGGGPAPGLALLGGRGEGTGAGGDGGA